MLINHFKKNKSMSEINKHIEEVKAKIAGLLMTKEFGDAFKAERVWLTGGSDGNINLNAMVSVKVSFIAKANVCSLQEEPTEDMIKFASDALQQQIKDNPLPIRRLNNEDGWHIPVFITIPPAPSEN